MKHRGHGEGSIYQRESDGRWTAMVTVGDGRRTSVYGKSYEEVRRKLTTIVRESDMGLPIVGEKQNAAQYLTAWLQVAKPTIRPRSWRRYEELTRRHIVPTLGKTVLARLTA